MTGPEKNDQNFSISHTSPILPPALHIDVCMRRQLCVVEVHKVLSHMSETHASQVKPATVQIFHNECQGVNQSSVENMTN